MANALPTYFVSHGGGPWPFMKEQYGATYDQLEASLLSISKRERGMVLYLRQEGRGIGLLKAVDDKLYEAKHSGRNRVCS